MQPSMSPPEPVVAPGSVAPAVPIGPRPRNAVVIVIVMLAGILLLAGVVVLQARILVELPSNPADYLAWQRTLRVMTFVGFLLLNVGVFVLLLVGMVVGLFRSDLPDSVRRAMIVMPGVLLIIWLLGFLLTGSVFAPSFP